MRDERRARAEKIAEDEARERALEELAQRMHIDIDDPIRKPIDVSGVIEALVPKSIVRRGLGDARPDVDDGRRAIVLRTRRSDDEPRRPKRKRGRRRGANDPPE